MRSLRALINRLFSEINAFTVVELLVAVSLLLIVLTIAFTFFGYGVNAFNTGEKRTLVQTNARLASRIITDELRYAESVVIHQTLPVHVSGIRTIYLNVDGTIMIRDEEGSERKIAGDFSDGVTFTELVFDINVGSLFKTILFSLTAERDGEQEYSLVSEVIPLNQKGRISYAVEGQPGSVLTYALIPPEEEAQLNAFPRQIIEQTGSVVFNLILLSDSFVDLKIEDISLGGDFNNSFSINSLDIVDVKEVNISINGPFSEGIGLITIDGNALLNSPSLSVEIFVIQNFVFIENDYLPDGMVGVNYSVDLTAVGGLEPYIFSFDQTDPAHHKPSWLSLDPGGLLRGIPDTESEITVKIAVTDDSVSTQTDAKVFTFNIDPLRYNLTMFARPGGKTDPPVGNTLFAPNEVVAITATPDPGFVFVSWTGSNVVNPLDNPTTVVMTENILVTARFASLNDWLKDVPGGKFIIDDGGNFYIKLCGTNDRVLSYYAEGSLGFFDTFDSDQKNWMPSYEEISCLSMSNQIRKEPDGKEYWTNTYADKNLNKAYMVTSTGSIDDPNISAKKAYLRRVVEFPGRFVDKDDRDGSLENPYLIL